MLFPGSPRAIHYGSPVTVEHPLNRGLVAWWQVLPKRYGGRRWLDLARIHHGTLTSMGPSSAVSGWGATTRPGGYGELRCDGTDDAVDVAVALGGMALASAFTWTCWMRFVAFPASNANMYAFVWSASGAYFFGVRTVAGVTTTNFGRNAIANDVVGVLPLSTLTWYHAAVTVTAGAVVQTYLNGLPDTSGTTSLATPSVTFSLGGSAGRFLNGSLDDLRIYNRVLPAADVQALYLASRRRPSALLNYVTPVLWGSPAAGGTILPQMLQHNHFAGGQAA